MPQIVTNMNEILVKIMKNFDISTNVIPSNILPVYDHNTSIELLS